MPVAAVAAVRCRLRRRPASFVPSSFCLSVLGLPALLEGPLPPSLARSVAALYSTSHARPDDRSEEGQIGLHTHTVAISLSFSLVAKRSFVVPLFAVVRTSSLTMISCKGLLRCPYSSGRIGPSCGICGRQRHEGI